MNLIITFFDLENDLGSSILFHKWILEVRTIWKSGITLLSRHISSKVAFFSVFDMVIMCSLAIMQIEIFPKVAVVATKLNFLQYAYRFRINHNLYSQTFPGPHFGSWTNCPVDTDDNTISSGADNCIGQKTRSNYDTSNRFGINTLWGSLFTKKRGPRKISIWPPFSKMAAMGYPKMLFFCFKNGYKWPKRWLWQQSVCFELAKCAVNVINTIPMFRLFQYGRQFPRQ